MGWDAIEFMTAMAFDQVDLLGFSIGSFVAQEIALIRPSLVRRLVLASSAPKGAPGMHGWAAQVIDAVGHHQPNPEGVLAVFYAGTPTSGAAGEQSLKRIVARTDDRDEPTTW
jgi:pimeloyl-ACP methyl ester carboxylesterase